MLHLSTRAARRIGASYVCARCLAASPTPAAHRATALITHHHNGRSLSTTPLRARPDVESQPSPAEDSPAPVASPPESQASSSSPPKKEKKKKSKKPAAKSTAKPAAQKPDAAQPDAERQLHVLQDALTALRNVLAAQNIDVENIKNAATSKKTEGDKKPKSKSKPSKADNQKAKKDAKAEAVSDSLPHALGKEDVTRLQQALIDADRAVSLSSSKQPASKATAPKSTTKKSKGAKKAAKAAAKRTRANKEPKPAASTSSKDKTEAPELEIRRIEGDSKSNMSPREIVPYKAIGKPFSGELPPGLQRKKKKKSGKEDATPEGVSRISSKDLSLVPISTVKAPVPSLSYGLDRVLFNPGVYFLQDPRSRVFNFDPYLSKIMPLREFDFTALKQYVTSSKDTTLIGITKEHNKKYTGSTSSMTSMLAHFHYLISSWRNINTSMLSQSIKPDSFQFTRLNRTPAAIFLNYKDGTYAIDADKEFDTANILSMLGKSMEKLLTLPKEEFERYRHINSDQITEEEREAEEAFHYTGFEDFMMRSQLDAHDPRVPGTGMFDLKTRAVISIRMDARGYEKGLGYEIRNRFGEWASFEREYYDMIRSAFMKYSLQVRMGRMDGIFVAFHNTERIFGFQYISLPEMDLTLHGSTNTAIGDHEFKFSLNLLNKILNRATEKFPEKSLRLHFETRTSVGSPFMYVFAKPVEQKDIDEVQNAGKASVEAFEARVLGMHKKVEQAEQDAQAEQFAQAEQLEQTEQAEQVEQAEQTQQVEEAEQAEEVGQVDPATISDEAVEDEEIEESEPLKSPEDAWEEMRQTVEDAMEDDELGVGTVREAIEDALEESGLIRAKSSEEAREYVDALLTAITGTEHPRPVELSDSPSEEVLDETSEGTAAENPSDIESQDSNDAPTPEVGKTLNATEIVEESDLKPELDSSIDETPSSTPHESGTLVGSQEVDGADKDTPVDSEASSSIHETTSQGQGQITTDSSAESEAAKQEETAVEEEEEDDEIDEDEDEDVAGSKDDATSASDLSPLKDLIVRMAQKIDSRAASEEKTDDSLNYSSKLKSFERILGELISSAKVVESEQQPSSDPESRVAEETQTSEPVEAVAEPADAGAGAVKAPSSSAAKAAKDAEPVEEGDLLGMVLTIKNKVNGKYVTRPENLTEHDEWDLEYNIEELPDQRARRFYAQCKARRKKVLQEAGSKDDEQWYNMFQGQLFEQTTKGREWRAREEEENRKRPIWVVGQDEPLQWKDVFGSSFETEAAASPSDSAVEEPAVEESTAEESTTEESTAATSDVEADIIYEDKETDAPSETSGKE